MMEESKITNLSFLKDNTGDNPEFLVEMLELLVKRLPEDLDKMLEFYKENKGKEVSAIAHKMKPSFEMVGAFSLKETAVFIESNAKNNTNSDEVEKKIHHFKSAVSQLIDELNTELKSFRQ